MGQGLTIFTIELETSYYHVYSPSEDIGEVINMEKYQTDDDLCKPRSSCAHLVIVPLLQSVSAGGEAPHGGLLSGLSLPLLLEEAGQVVRDLLVAGQHPVHGAVLRLKEAPDCNKNTMVMVNSITYLKKNLRHTKHLKCI